MRPRTIHNFYSVIFIQFFIKIGQGQGLPTFFLGEDFELLLFAQGYLKVRQTHAPIAVCSGVILLCFCQNFLNCFDFDVLFDLSFWYVGQVFLDFLLLVELEQRKAKIAVDVAMEDLRAQLHSLVVP